MGEQKQKNIISSTKKNRPKLVFIVLYLFALIYIFRIN